MKTALIGLLLIGIAASAWLYFGAESMKPYPLIDPVAFVSILPNPPVYGASQDTDPKYYNKFGYLKGERGAASAIAVWTRRPVPDSDPYDVDLSMIITATPSPGVASEGFALALLQDRKIPMIVEIPPPGALRAGSGQRPADETQGQAGLHVVNVRHGNYLFRFVARVVAEGYFESEAQFLERMRTLNEHIRSTLEHAIRQ